jgi:DNA-binding SARP family transcriptional activator
MRTLHIQLLGAFRLVYGEELVTSLSSARLRSLLAYLLLHRNAPQPRAQIAFIFWPKSTESQARNSLRNLLYRLRQKLPDADRFLYVNAQTLQWRPQAPFELDVADFEQAMLQVDSVRTADNQATMRTSLETAVALYQGDLLPSCYDDWILPDRQRLRIAFLSALDRLIRLLASQQQYLAAIRYADRLLQHDPLHETNYRRLMQLHAQHGNRAAALRVYQRCVETLNEKLGVEPDPRTQTLHAQLLEIGPD